MDKKRFLVCVNSDGCAMDTMNIKHKECYGPELAEVWHLEPWTGEVFKIWNLINLYGRTRGINRFLGLEKALSTFKDMGILKDDISALTKWTRETRELSNSSLKQEMAKTKSNCLEKTYEWSLRVDEAIGRLPQAGHFKGVEETLKKISEDASVVIVSSADKKALLEEWEASGFLSFVSKIMGQEEGTKAQCIRELKRAGYGDAGILMVGDAPGDLEAAEENRVFFYPILPGREEPSWQRLNQEAFQKLLSRTYEGAYQASMVKEFNQILD